VSVGSVVRQLSQLPCSRCHVLLLWTVGHSVAEGKTLVEALHNEVPDGKFLGDCGNGSAYSMLCMCICV